MKIIVITTGLNVGGAETVLLSLVKEWLAKDLMVTVFSLSGVCHLDDTFRELGVDVKSYDLKGPLNTIQGLFKLTKDLRNINPQIVQTWMPHADLVGGLMAKVFTSAKILWGCHHADISLRSLKLRTLAIIKINSLLSYFVPDCIVAVSKHVESQLINYGFDQRKLYVIENGIDCSVFKKTIDSKERLFDELNINNNKKMVGFIGRYSFEKRPSDFLKLAARLNENFSNLHFLMVGDGNDEKNKELLKLIAVNKLGQHISLLGVRDDIPAILSSLDLLISTSLDEAFGLVLIEALACGCPCVSSNNEGAKSVGGGFIQYAEIADIEAFFLEASTIISQDDSNYECFSEKSSEYICSRFSIEHTANSYLDLYFPNNTNFRMKT